MGTMLFGILTFKRIYIVLQIHMEITAKYIRVFTGNMILRFAYNYSQHAKSKYLCHGTNTFSKMSRMCLDLLHGNSVIGFVNYFPIQRS